MVEVCNNTAPELGPVVGTSTWDQYLGPVVGTKERWRHVTAQVLGAVVALGTGSGAVAAPELGPEG